MADVLVIIATGVAWWSLIPQIRRLVKTRDPTGVSSSWPAIGLVTNAGWTAYLASQRLWAAAPSTTVMTVSYGLVLWALFAAGRAPRRGILAGAVWASVLATTGITMSWTAMGALLAGSYLIQFAPAVAAAYRVTIPSGIAPATWVSIGIESALWGGYGVLKGDLPVTAYATIGLTGACAILWRYRSATAATSTGTAGSSTTKQV